MQSDIQIANDHNLYVKGKEIVEHNEFITIGGKYVKAKFDLSEIEDKHKAMAIRIIQQSGTRVVGTF